MKPFRISRRFLLRGVGSIGVALPLLDVMTPLRRAAAQTAASPKRFVAFYEQSGYNYNQWKPTGSAANFTLSPTLSPLEPYKAKLLVIDGLNNGAAKVSGDDHQKGMSTMLTGTEMIGSTANPTGGGISLDQEIASKIGTSTKFKSLELGVLAGSGNAINYMSYAGASQPLPAVSDPAQIYSRVFSSFTAPTSGGTTTQPDAAAFRLVAQRKSVLDTVKEAYTSLSPRVSAADRVKLDAHLTSIREIEKSLTADPAATTTTTKVGTACVKPASPTIDSKKNDNFPTIAKLQIDLLAMAFICDLTRVGVIQISYEAGDPVYTWLNINRGHHAISHDADSDSNSQAMLASIDKWHAQQFAYLLSKLDGAVEGTGTVLDNSLALWVNGLAKGNVHSHGPNPPQPIVTAGSAGGAIKPGRYITAASNTNTNDVYISILQAMGISATTFGNAKYCKGPLPGFAG